LAQAEGMAVGRVDRWPLTDHMIVGLPVSQLQAGAWSVTQRREQPQDPVEERELRALLGRALRLAVNRLKSAAPPAEGGQTGRKAGDREGANWVLLDATTVAVRVEGKAVTDPVGFRGQELGATVFAALASTETIEVWRRVAADLDFSTLTITAVPLALVPALTEPQGVLLDMGGATTDLTLWQSGRPVAVGSLPMGGALLSRALMQAWDLSPDRAELLKRAYASGQLTGSDRVQVLEVMLPVLRAWLEQTEALLATLHGGRPLPQRIYLSGGGSGLTEVMEAVCSLAWSESLRFERYPQVDRLRPTDVAGVLNRTDWGRGAGDVSAMALASWAARQNLPLDRPGRILQELCGGQCSG
jgi:hypothetical protein